MATAASHRLSTFRRFAEPGLVAAAFGVIYLILEPSSADHAAQVFRSGIYENEGISAWNNLWFGGHHLPGYSVLFPAVGSLVGPREAGVLATIAAALLFSAIAYRRWGDRARLGVIWFAAGASISLFSGRLAFSLGVALALGAVLAAQRGMKPVAIVLAVLCPLASPVAALFLACGAVAHAFAERTRGGLELAVAALGTAVLLALAFPEGGSEPFVFSSFQPAILIAVAVFLAIPKEETLLRYGVAAYGFALAAAFLIDSPMGGNATRMGALFLGPALAFGLWRRQKLFLVLLAPFLLYWQWSPVVRDLEKVHAQPSVDAGYYAPVRDYLRGATDKGQYRVEVLPASHHWEAAYVPRGIYIARGWERQLDRKLNHLFYTDSLGADKYRRWLDRLAVRYVALSDGPLDYAGRHEASLIRHGVPYLRPAFRSADWTVYEVTKAAPLAQRPARLVALDADGFSVYAPHPGAYLVRIRHSSYFSLSDGVGCVEASPGGFTIVRMAQAGVADVNSDFSPLRIFERGPACRSAP